MVGIMKLSLIVFIFFGFSWAIAQVENSTEIISNAPKVWSAAANLETASFVYKEPGVMTVTGRLNGVSGQIQYKSDSNLWFQANGKYLTGTGNYDGRYDDFTPATSTDNYRVLDLAAKGMLLTDLGTEVQTSLFIGLGRRVTDDLDDASPSDYYRQHIYNYYSLGTQIVIPHDFLTSSTLILGFDTMYAGTTETRLSDVASYYPDFTLNFKGGSAFNLEWQINRNINSLNLFGGLAYQKWTLNESEIATVTVKNKTRQYIEPQNETTTLAVKVGANF